jgi:predicted MFS family arabinose efflux permease
VTAGQSATPRQRLEQAQQEQREQRLAATALPPCDYSKEDVADAELEGDRTFNPGTARAALTYSGFRRVFAGSVASNVGSWMQNFVLGAFAYTLTKSATFVSIIQFAQLGPLLFVSLIGGSLADRFNRKRLLVLVSAYQAFFAFALAWVVRDPDPSKVAIVALVFAIGMGQAIAGPTFASVLPSLVSKRDLPGAVSLTSANMNLSRMAGAPLGAFVYATYGVSWVFAANAVTYFFIIAGVGTVLVPRPEPLDGEVTGIRRIVSGFGIARADAVISRVLITLVVFSFFSLIFVVQMPSVAANFDISEKSTSFGVLYATFAFGAMVGALSVGSYLAGRDLGRLVQIGLGGFTAMLVAFALWRHPAPAFPTAFLLGFFYFMVITSLSTLLQERLDNNNRGRVMAIWIMAFGGTVPIGNLAAGRLIDAVGITPVMLVGAAVAAALIFYTRALSTAHADQTLAPA